MPRKGHPEEQIIFALRQVEGGKKVVDICREMGVSQQAFYSWKRRCARLGLNELREFRQLREESRKLKTLVADLTLDKHILQEVLSRKGPEARSAAQAGVPGAEWISAQRDGRLRADRNYSLDEPLPKPARSPDRIADESTGTGRQ
jgi:putative transposase